ncbi:putative lipoprotein YdaJ [Ornithinibacillus bavariensis]|uniref:Lipoprotein YdaJ n=2 Tax=Ornithinibacillus bavariensis TaxID=545502 RepID=A0A919X485_9BACI|nr:putative lipoprotein YdaJ [Ornithinibacillus bavariensis]
MNMKKSLILTVFLLIILLLILWTILSIRSGSNSGLKMKDELSGEAFVKNQLYEKNGLIKTDLTNQSDIYLSESIGLWMEYLVEKSDQAEFDKQVKVLKKYFMNKSTLIPWLIEKNDPAPANALIDDLRIIHALQIAGENWNNKTYLNMAKKMSEELVKVNMLDGVFINHVDIKSQYKGDFLTLSYLVPDTLDYMYKENILQKDQYERNRNILLSAPLSENGFFPQNYYPNEKRYEYDKDINLIDQYYIGYHRALWGGDVSALVEFTKESLDEYDGVLYGRFSNETKQPIVQYEGASVYALAILMCLEIEEHELAKQLYESMKKHQINDESSKYYGGYIDLPSLVTHAFDNLLPLLAERKGIDEGVFE